MQKAIAIVGPTSSGKTTLSIKVAKHIDGEVISADSRQVYRGLDLASGKVTEDEKEDIPHHLLDVADPRKVFTASDFVELGTKALESIYAQDKVPVVAGGTGFYIDALLGRVSFAEVPPNKRLRAELEEKSIQGLQNLLKNLDTERFETIDTKNPRRLIRAIEVAHALGKNPKPTNDSPYSILWIGISVPHDVLKEKIHTRLLQRLEKGMVDELKNLHTKGLSYERMEQLGLECRYVARYLKEELSYDEMVSELSSEIVKYAKRQMTWFNANKEIQWFRLEETENVLDVVDSFIKK